MSVDDMQINMFAITLLNITKRNYSYQYDCEDV